MVKNENLIEGIPEDVHEQVKAQIDVYAFKSPLDSLDKENREPILAQLDEWSRSQALRQIYTYRVMPNADGILQNFIVGVKYPDIEEMSSHALSHLNMMTNITWEDSRAAIMNFVTGEYSRLFRKYRRNEEARNILIAIKNIYVRNVTASVDGTQQDYAAQWSGGKKTLDVKYRQPELAP